MQACVNILSDGLIQTLLDCESYLVCNGCRVQQYYSRNRDSSWSRMFFRVPILPCRQAGTSKCSQSEFISAGRDCDVTPPPTSSNEHSHPLGSLMQTKKNNFYTLASNCSFEQRKRSSDPKKGIAREGPVCPPFLPCSDGKKCF